MKVIVFGLEQRSSVAWYWLTHDSPHEVVAFTVDAAWRSADTLHGLPVVTFEDLEKKFPSHDFALHIPLGWTRCNGLRAAKYREAKARGYSLVSYISSRADVSSGAELGEHCAVQPHAKVLPFARVGNDCILGSGCLLSHHVSIGEHVFVAPHAVVGGGATVGDRCVLGLNSTVIDGIAVAPGCFVAAGAVVTADTEPDGLYVGVPARRKPLPERVR